MARTKAVIGAGARLSDYLMLAHIALNCPLDKVQQALAQHGKQSRRRRGLSHEVLVYYVMCLCLYRDAAYEQVLHIVIEGLRRIYGDVVQDVAVTKGAISQARTRVGADVIESLYRSQVQVVGPAQMSSVWYRGHRVMGLDGSTLELPDEAANAEHFGYPDASRGTAAFPQLRFCALAECGTHILIGARMGPYAVSEHALAAEVLSVAHAGMIILAERGFVGFALWQRAHDSGARLLFRVRDTQLLPVRQRLPDGSYLSALYETPKARRHGQGVTVRVIEYMLEDQEGGYRLITNWLDPEQAPAQELAAVYRRRWRIEVALGEIKTQCNSGLGLRSKTPELVRQEFYALLMAHASIRTLMTQAAAGCQPRG